MIVMVIVAMPVMVYAERAIHAADRATHSAADNTTNWASGGSAFCGAALHASKNALRMNRDRRGEQAATPTTFSIFSIFTSKLGRLDNCGVAHAHEPLALRRKRGGWERRQTRPFLV
jgi:hypothetical protein